MKKYFIIQWLGSYKLYVQKTYGQRIVASEHKINARKFDKSGAEKIY